MDFHQRKVMINEEYPNVQCFYIKDTKENSVWSTNLDGQIADMLLPMQKPLLYGSRDSFIKAYHDGGGKYDTEILESKSMVSATEIRQRVSRGIMANFHVRLGMVLASFMRWPTGYVTVDVAVMDDDRKKIWLGRKDGEKEYRFFGGFNDPESMSLEDDAKREVMEETHIEVSEPKYISSRLVDDWRYRTSKSKIKTTLWIADRIGGDPKPDDDIAEIKCFDIDFFMNTDTTNFKAPAKNLKSLVKEHRFLMDKLVDYLYDNK